MRWAAATAMGAIGEAAGTVAPSLSRMLDDEDEGVDRMLDMSNLRK